MTPRLRSLGLAALAAGLSAVLSLGCGGSTPGPEQPVKATPAAGRLFMNEDVVAYTVKTRDGRIVGRTHSTYFDKGDGLTQVRTRLALDPSVASGSGGVSARTAELATTFNPDLTPLSYKELSSVDGRLELRFKDKLVTRITDVGARDLAYNRTGAMLVPAHDPMVLSLVLEHAKLPIGATAKIDVISPKLPSATDVLSVRVWSDAEGNTVVQSVGMRVVLDKSGRVATYEDIENGWTFEREVPPGDPPRVELPADQPKYARPQSAEWSDREVSIEVRDGVLAGTLSEPRLGPRAGRQLAPGIVFLSDLGLQDRNGFGGAIETGTWQVLDRLADEGFAVLRLDDRGAGGSTSKIAPEDAGLQLAVEDAAACVAFMRAQPTVDPERIFVLGHGLGGVTALLLAERTDLSGVALLAAPYRALPELMAATEAEQTGADREKLARELRLAVTALDGNQAARAQVGPARLTELSAMRVLYVEAGKVDLSKVLPKVKPEVAVFQGMKDFQTSWRDDAKPLADQLKKLGKKASRLFVYENVDHFMKSEPGVSSFKRYADRTRRVEGRFLDDLVGWLNDRMKTAR